MGRPGHPLAQVRAETAEGAKYRPQLSNAEKYNTIRSLEQGLKILHPMMPFVTEELWQRLPGRGTLGADEPRTIMLAPYPEGDEAFSNKKIEENMKIVMGAVTAARSMKTTYNVLPKERPSFFFKATAEVSEVLALQKDDIETLGKGILKIGESPPKASAIVVVDDSLTMYMDLAGMVDYAKELKKLAKEKGKLESTISSLETKMSKPDYEEKVKQEIKSKNTEALEANKAKLDNVVSAIKNFEEMQAAEKK